MKDAMLTRSEIRRALKNNCWNVYISIKKAATILRVVGVRRRGVETEVRTFGGWRRVECGDRVFGA